MALATLVNIRFIVRSLGILDNQLLSFIHR